MRAPLPLLALLLAIGSAACATGDPRPTAGQTPQVEPAPQPDAAHDFEALPANAAPAAHGRAFKGYELYSWQDARGAWRYALLPGTNRLKHGAEITSAAITEADLRQRLAQLPAVETVTWCPPPGMETDPPFAMPPDDVVAALMALAAEREVHLRTCD